MLIFLYDFFPRASFSARLFRLEFARREFFRYKFLGNPPQYNFFGTSWRGTSWHAPLLSSSSSFFLTIPPILPKEKKGAKAPSITSNRAPCRPSPVLSFHLLSLLFHRFPPLLIHFRFFRFLLCFRQKRRGIVVRPPFPYPSRSFSLFPSLPSPPFLPFSSFSLLFL